MTRVLRVRNVNHALKEGLWMLNSSHTVEESRNGPVWVAPGPVITEYTHPRERVLWDATRDANPVFHLIESLWMLAGRDDVQSLLPYNSNMKAYAEEDGKLHGAYGYRWREYFGVDQLDGIIELLANEPNTRRAVLGMWDPVNDLGTSYKDLPCNTHVYFDLRGNALNMTVCCRSNDVVWGAYGANAVHFSILQELVADALGVEVGVYRQMSNNYHIYTENPQVQRLMEDLASSVTDYYTTDPEDVNVVKLVQPYETYLDFLKDCGTMFSGELAGSFSTHFFKTVAGPLAAAYISRKEGGSIDWGTIQSSDWKTAFCQWVDRRVQPTEGGAA